MIIICIALELGSSENQMFTFVFQGINKNIFRGNEETKKGRNDSRKCELPKDQPQMLNLFFEYLLDPSSFCTDMLKRICFCVCKRMYMLHVYVKCKHLNVYVEVYVEVFTCYIYVLIYSYMEYTWTTIYSSSYFERDSRRSLLPVYPQLITMYRLRTWLVPSGGAGAVRGGVVWYFGNPCIPPKNEIDDKMLCFFFQVGV